MKSAIDFGKEHLSQPLLAKLTTVKPVKFSKRIGKYVNDCILFINEVG